MNKYLAVTTMSIKKNFTYRARMVIWFLVDTMNILVFPFLWLGIYATRESVAGFTRSDIVTYYLLMIIIALISSSHLSRGIYDDIMNGRLSSFLLRPMQHAFYHEAYEFGHKIVSSGFAFFLLIFFTFFFPDYIKIPSSVITVLWFILFLFFSHCLSTLIQCISGYSVFWLKETNAVMQFRYFLEKIFSGEFAPLALFPPLLQSIAYVLPFQYLYDVPARVFLGKISTTELYTHSLTIIGWLTLFTAIVYLMWRRGIRRYDGVGI